MFGGAQFGDYPTYTQKERPSRLHCMMETLRLQAGYWAVMLSNACDDYSENEGIFGIRKGTYFMIFLHAKGRPPAKSAAFTSCLADKKYAMQMGHKPLVRFIVVESKFAGTKSHRSGCAILFEQRQWAQTDLALCVDVTLRKI